MMSVEMALTAVGRTTIECCVRWCATRCAGSDTAFRHTSCVSREIHTSHCCCTVFTTMRCHCHSPINPALQSTAMQHVCVIGIQDPMLFLTISKVRGTVAFRSSQTQSSSLYLLLTFHLHCEHISLTVKLLKLTIDNRTHKTCNRPAA